MPDLEHDMDELFQRAAENYPLQSGKGDWNAVAKKMAAEYETAGIKAPVQNKKGRKIIYFFSLLIIGSFGWLPVKDLFQGKVLKHVISETALNIEHSQDASIIKKHASDYSLTDSPDVTGHEIGENKLSAINTSQQFVSVKKIKDNTSLQTGTKSHESKEEFFGDGSKIKQIEKDNPFNFSQTEIKKEVEKPVSDLAFENENISGRDLKILKDSSLLKSVLTKDDEVAVTDNTKKVKTTLKKKRGVYVGIIAGSDFSKVRSMSFDNSGFAAGVIAGFPINSKLSFETGITWNKKNYSSEGINFSMDKVGSSMAGMVINNLESKSTLIEVPVKVKYDFITREKSVFNISAGVAAYIMTEEKNLYNVSFNGNNEKVSGVYKKNNYRLPAVASIGVGYQRNLSNSIEIRVEPFLKIPLQGVGVGSLPLTSAGLQIGIISRLK